MPLRSSVFFFASIASVSAPCVHAQQATVVRVGSKSFTEGIILGEIATLMIRHAGLDVRHERSLGDASTFQALRRGDIDIYAEYTGTLAQSIFARQSPDSKRELSHLLGELGINMTSSLGFENSFALGTTRQLADELELSRISDLRRYPALRLGFTESFLNRGDGWPSLKRHYGLPQTDLRGIAHDLAYVALDSGDLDVIDLYTTDAEIVAYELVALRDDAEFFPQYEAVYLYRKSLADRVPRAVQALRRLDGTIDSEKMRQLNAAVKIDGRSEADVAAAFLRNEFGYDLHVVQRTFWNKLWARTKEHLFLVSVAMGLGTLAAVPLGIMAYKLPRVGRLILWTVSILQTVPALAFLALMVPFMGIKSPPAIAALFCYSMLPIVRNTHAGIANMAPQLRESAEALGLGVWTQLWRVELPLASPTILAGIKTATVLSIGFATLGAFVGAGGYGEPILTGIRLQDTGEILQGAVPAACMAIGAELFFDCAEPWLVPRGLRLTANP